MKHIILALIVLVLAAALSACGSGAEEPAEPDQPAAGEAPPELTLYINEEELLDLPPRTYEWNVDNGDGTWTGVCADAAHPLDARDDLPEVDTSAAWFTGTVDILLEEGMEITGVSWWDAEQAGYDDQQEVSGEVLVTDKTVYRLPVAAGRVYEIHVDFGDRGDSFYAFAAR
ncbi:MAG: hypothetical protein IIY40_04435 [Firmicutes bacterium]|nr:hypothetical protein [Bacillota bacterium]MBR2783114.1 hypothetical protein [Bacillota bacterium]